MTFKSTTNLFAPATIVFAIRHSDDSNTYTHHMYSQTDYALPKNGSVTVTLTSNKVGGKGFCGVQDPMDPSTEEYQVGILDYVTSVGQLDAVTNRVTYEDTTVYGSAGTNVSDTATFVFTTNDTAEIGTVYVIRFNSPTKYMETIYVRITIVA
jgi:uncharacterized protein YndB with AHSA1/START domain